MGLCDFSLFIYFVMIVRIGVLKHQIEHMNHELEFGVHETSVYALYA